MSNSQLNKLESAIKYATEVTLKLPPNVISDCNGETNFPNKILLTDRLVSNLRIDFANNLLANIKLSKTQLHKIAQSSQFLGRRLGLSLKTVLPLMKNILKPLTKSVLIPLALTATLSATATATQK